MRIISGNLKGKKILQPKDTLTRPLKDLTKESIFNIIQHSKSSDVKIKNSSILDLFSGVGSFGLECLSRGASTVTFLENHKEALTILKKNIQNLELDNYSKIVEKNIFEENTLISLNNRFEIIFLDPPYKEKQLMKLLNKIIHLRLLKENGIFIIHRHKKEEDIFPDNFKIILKRSYGVSKIIFGKQV